MLVKNVKVIISHENFQEVFAKCLLCVYHGDVQFWRYEMDIMSLTLDMPLSRYVNLVKILSLSIHL